MIDNNIENIIVKFITNQATFKEIKQLEKWVIENEDNNKKFKEYILLNYALDYELEHIEIAAIKNTILIKSNISKKQLPITNYLKYAAAILVLIYGSYFLYNSSTQDKTIPTHITTAQPDQLIINNESIILRNEKGDELALDEDASTKIKSKQGNIIASHTKSKIIYEEKNEDEELIYNEIIVPFGKRFQLQLSDGTVVHLNAGTTLKYPINFSSKKDREVYLIKGEALFNVAENKNHPFIVNKGNHRIKVLGTVFNVSAYAEDSNIKTVLVSGKVQVNTQASKKAIDLKPNQMSVYKKTDETIQVKNVNTALYTAWVQGQIILKRTRFSKIRQKLERHYNVTINNNNKKLDTQLYNINFNNETIEQVLKTLNESFAIEYEIIDNTILIQ